MADNIRREVSITQFYNDLQSMIGRNRRAIGTGRGEGVEYIGDPDYLGIGMDLLALEPQGIALPVPAFMVLLNNSCYFRRKINLLELEKTIDGMRFDQGILFREQPAGFFEQVCGNSQLTNVVQQGTQNDLFQRRIRQTEIFADQIAETSHVERMSKCIRIMPLQDQQIDAFVTLKRVECFFGRQFRR